MPVTLVTDPAHVVMDPDAHPWDARLKYAAVGELLADYQASNALVGRDHCPVADYFAAHLDDDVLEVEDHVYAHPQWGPFAICESLHRTLLFNNAQTHAHGEFIAGWAQRYLLHHLVRHHPYERARGPFEAMLKERRMRFVVPEAAYVALAYLNAGHPNPRRFLEKPEVRAKFPTDLELSRFAAPHFEEAR
jgi:hypothetical protein